VLLLFAADLAVMALDVHSVAVLSTCVIVSGAFLGINNTLITEAVMLAAPVERGVASAAYSFVRFGGAAVAPWLAGKLGETVSPRLPFAVGAVATVLAVTVLLSGRKVLAHIDRHEPVSGSVDEAGILAAADA